MISPELCTDEEVADFVRKFYAKVRRDDLIGPIFNARIEDWDHHLALLTDFWTSILRGTGRYAGTPMQKHVALPELSPAMFERWLSLFDETLAAQPNAALRERARGAAQRIAQSLWYAWQMGNRPDKLPTDLPRT